MKNEFLHKIKVYIEDTDYGGVVYHANYLKYFERARSEWIDKAGLGLAWQQQQGIYFLVHSAHIDYIKPAQLFDDLIVVSRLMEIKQASVTFEQYLRQEADADKIICRAKIRVACTDTAMQVRALPKVSFFDSMRRIIQ